MLFRPSRDVASFMHGKHRLVGDLVLPMGAGPHPAVVTVFGSGPGGRHLYDWAPRFAAAGFAFYTYDRPGCGESTGDWQAMDFTDRADETLAAVAAIAAHPAIDPDRIALFGGSQGGWVAPAAAARSSAVTAVVTFSGPGVSPAAQEEYRIGRGLTGAGLGADDVAAGVAYTHFMYDRLRAGDSATAILRDLDSHPEVTWLPLVRAEHESVEGLEFVRRILDYDPLPALHALRCPLLAIFGDADALVPVADSVRLIEHALTVSKHPDAHIVVFPDCDHGIRPVTPAQPTTSAQRAAGFFELIIGWLTRRLGERTESST
jgi:pimeloyl-ACP methyl ester carboxylesterase